mmetsp:Transcript_1788/g.4494  ORF Transcript_1788/g.4494 Transcript_1788/m.4494 type:complete len:335 (+) Transcript_1788:2025-3029(+)
MQVVHLDTAQQAFQASLAPPTRGRRARARHRLCSPTHPTSLSAQGSAAAGIQHPSTRCCRTGRRRCFRTSPTSRSAYFRAATRAGGARTHTLPCQAAHQGAGAGRIKRRVRPRHSRRGLAFRSAALAAASQLGTLVRRDVPASAEQSLRRGTRTMGHWGNVGGQTRRRLQFSRALFGAIIRIPLSRAPASGMGAVRAYCNSRSLSTPAVPLPHLPLPKTHHPPILRASRSPPRGCPLSTAWFRARASPPPLAAEHLDGSLTEVIVPWLGRPRRTQLQTAPLLASHCALCSSRRISSSSSCARTSSCRKCIPASKSRRATDCTWAGRSRVLSALT